jgi:hypothetical protein
MEGMDYDLKVENRIALAAQGENSDSFCAGYHQFSGAHLVEGSAPFLISEARYELHHQPWIQARLFPSVANFGARGVSRHGRAIKIDPTFVRR